MNLRGLPDFQRPLVEDGLTIFYPYEGDGRFLLAPDLLEIAEREDGRPDFMLQLVRSKTQYGKLDFRLRPRYRMGEGLALLRAHYPGAVLGPAIFSSGFLRFQFGTDIGSVPQDLSKPVALAWNSLGVARFTVTLSPDSALLIKKGLQDDAFAMGAAAELELLGVAPRVPIRVTFDPARLLGAIATVCDRQHGIAQDDLASFFRQDRKNLPIEINGEIEPTIADEFASALADRIRTRFGTFSPSPSVMPAAYFLLAGPETVGSGKFDWNLADPFATTRTHVLSLHPLETVHELVKNEGTINVCREITVPPLPIGTFTVNVVANLYTERLNVVSVGVELRVPPHPPVRPQTVTATALLKPPSDTASVLLRLSPLEQLAYTYTTYAVVSSARGIERLEGKPGQHMGDYLDLDSDDFPVSFCPVAAAPDLLEIATVHGVCRWNSAGLSNEQPFDLDDERPTLTLALPTNAEKATLEIEAMARTGSKVLKLGPFPANTLCLDRFSFREYGPHKIDIECAFIDATGIYVIELIPEGKPDVSGELTVLGFTRDQPKKEWTYFADSPFAAGYRYRRRRSASEPPATWSETQSPFEALKISAAVANVGGAA
jgi:hypothetical protein